MDKPEQQVSPDPTRSGLADPHDWYIALAYTVRDRMLERWVSMVRTYAAKYVKVGGHAAAFQPPGQAIPGTNRLLSGCLGRERSA